MKFGEAVTAGAGMALGSLVILAMGFALILALFVPSYVGGTARDRAAEARYAEWLESESERLKAEHAQRRSENFLKMSSSDIDGI